MSQGIQQDSRRPWWDVPFSDSWTLPGMLMRSAKLHCNASAVLDDDGTWITFNELIQSGSDWSQHIIRSGLGRPLRIACLASTTRAFYTGVIAGIISGSRVVLLDHRVPADRNRTAMNDARVDVILVDKSSETSAYEISSNSVVVMRVDGLPESRYNHEELSCPHSKPDCSNEFVIFTSGSTGRPKGVIRSFQSMLHAIYNYSRRFESNCDDVMLYVGSPGHVGTLNDVLCGLLSGYAVVPVRPDTLDIERTASLIATLGVNKIAVPPSLLRLLFRRHPDRADFRSLEMITPSGEPLLRSDLRLMFDRFGPGLKIWQSYGSTEVGHICSGMYTPADAEDCGPLPLRRLGDGINIELVDQDGCPTGLGRGTIRVRSNYLADGYLRPEMSDSLRFGSDSRGRYFDTGDQARLNEDGSFVLEGRSDRQIGIRGQRFELGDVESAVLTTPGWYEAAATVIQSEFGESQIAVVVSGDPNVSADLYNLKAALREKLPSFAVPQYIFSVEALPRTATAKVDLVIVDKIVREQVMRSRELLAEASEPPRGPCENWIADAWQFVMRSTARPRRHVRFDDFGGDSLAALALCLEIGEQTGLALGMDFITEFMSIREQAEEIERRRTQNQTTASVARLVPLGDCREGPSVVMIPGVGGHAWVYRSIARDLTVMCDLRCIQFTIGDGMASSQLGPDAIATLVRDHLSDAGDGRPFVLGGFSYGAIIAIDVAKRLKTLGVVTDDLLLIDPAMSSWSTSLRREWRECRLKVRNLFGRSSTHARSILDHEVWLTSKAIRREYPLRRRVQKDQRYHALLSSESWSVQRFNRVVGNNQSDSEISISEDLSHLDLMRERGASRVAKWMDVCISRIHRQNSER